MAQFFLPKETAKSEKLNGFLLEKLQLFVGEFHGKKKLIGLDKLIERKDSQGWKNHLEKNGSTLGTFEKLHVAQQSWDQFQSMVVCG